MGEAGRGRLRRAALLREGQVLEDAGGSGLRWQVLEALAEGGFGQIFLAEEVGGEGAGRVAIKAEAVGEEAEGGRPPATLLRIEREVYADLRGREGAGFLGLLGWGRLAGTEWLAMEEAGRNLAELKRLMGGGADWRFSETSSLRLGLQMLAALEELHGLGWLHRDVKPSNWCLRREGGGLGRGLVLLDFGLGRRWRDAQGRHRLARLHCGFRGTLRYASVRVHLGQDMGRRDDLASLLYVLCEQRLGRLPWRRLQDKPLVLDHKAEFAQSLHLWGPETSPALVGLFREVQALAFPDAPDYASLRRLFHQRLLDLDPEGRARFEWDALLPPLPPQPQPLPADPLNLPIPAHPHHH